MSEQCVKIIVKLSNEEQGTQHDFIIMQQIGILLRNAISRDNTGEYDGSEFGEGFCTHFIYSPDAEEALKSISRLLSDFHFDYGGHVVKRFGPPGSPEERLPL